jgi:CheY-like chemotaxis protein
MYSQFSLLADVNAPEPRWVPHRRRLLLAHGDPHYVAAVRTQFERLGWDVQIAQKGSDIRQLARQQVPTLVVLAADAPEETGWLTCAKLRRELPECRVILVGSDMAAECFRLTQFVGAAALVAQRDGVGALMDEVYGELQLPAVG